MKVERLNSGILRDINLTWEKGEVLALMGPNGSGKSTLARALAGLGEGKEQVGYYCAGKPVSWAEMPRWQVIGIVRQHPRRQCIGASVAEELSFGLLNLGYTPAQIRARLGELTESLGLGGREGQSPTMLSGGERQRLAVGAVLAMEPAFLILDEAFSMLDQRARESLLALLRRKRGEVGQLWITHDADLALRADGLLLIREGRLRRVENPAAFLHDEEQCAAYKIRPAGCRFLPQKGAGADQKTDRNAVRPGDPVLVWKNAVFGQEPRLRLKADQTVRKGEFIGVLGPSGAGKTTLLESAVGLVAQNKGEVSAFGVPIAAQKGKELRTRIRLILQEAGEFLIGDRVYPIVFKRQPDGAGKNQYRKDLDYLARFGLSEALCRERPEKLSGGERQLVALALSLASDPEVVLLDEPLLGLDAAGQERVLKIVESIRGKTLLYVTHDLREVLPYADRLWLVEKGNIALDCPKEGWEEHRAEFVRAGVRVE